MNVRRVNRWVRQNGRLLSIAARRAASFVVPYRPEKGGAKKLDEEYARGMWDYLQGIPEAPRLGITATYCHLFAGNGSILEVGCGEATLLEHLCPSRYYRYVGIDLSSEAIERAKRRGNEKTTFLVADASEFQTDERFNVIVFNECIQYFDDPVGQVGRYERFLTENGYLIISQFVGTHAVFTKKFWKMISERYRIKAESRITTLKTRTSIIKTLRPGERAFNA